MVKHLTEFMLVMFLIMPGVILGCTPTVTVETMQRPTCSTKEERTELAKFIVDCSKAANPMSDEEGEDLVAQCEQTGVRTICHNELFCQTTTRSFLDVDFTNWAPCK